MAQAGVKVATIEPQIISESVALTGTIIANPEKLAKIAPRVAGRVTSAPAALGSVVQAGQTLAVLDSIELAEARSAYRQAASEVTVAQSALVRTDELAAAGVVPDKDYQRAKADAERARSVLRAASDKLKLLGVSPSADDSAAVSVFPLVAPFTGTIIERKAVIGELAPQDQALFMLADLSTVSLEADVFEKDLGKIALGAPVTATVAAYPDTAFKGKLTYLGDTMDKITRTVKARIELPNAARKLKPGMFATADVLSTRTVEALTVPKEAVLLMQGQPAVFVAENQAFKPRAIETGPAVAGRIPVLTGLTAGERIVVAGAYSLKARLLKSQFSTAD